MWQWLGWGYWGLQETLDGVWVVAICVWSLSAPRNSTTIVVPFSTGLRSLALHMVSLVVTTKPPALRALSSYLVHREGGAQKSRNLVRVGLRSREKNWSPGLLAPPPIAGPRALFPLWMEPLLHEY